MTANKTLNTAISVVNAAVGKNRIINGDMRIDQRNGGTSYTPNNNYHLDRWFSLNSQTSKFTVQQNAGSVTPPAGYTYYLGATSSSAYSVGSGDYFTISQRIEGYNAADLDFGKSTAKTITISFWVRSSLTGTFGGALRNNANNRSYPFTYTISSANTWEQKTVTVNGDTSGTWETTTNTGIEINFSLGTGATYSGTANSWAGANYVNATGSTSVVGTSGATWYITGVQIEAGSSATPFERRLYGQELSLCMRYYQLLYSSSYRGYVGNVERRGFQFAVPMRAAPTLTSTVTASSGYGTFSPGSAFDRWTFDIQYTGGGTGVIDLSSLNVVASIEL